MSVKVKDHFNSDEITYFCSRRNDLAWIAVLVSWAIIAAAFLMVAVWPNPLTIILALLLLGGRQLGLGVLMHECGHGTLFKSKALNKWVGTWLCAAPVMYRLDDYMSNHLSHHAKAGSAEDPDLYRYNDYPVPVESLTRKLLRDLSGRTSLNFLKTSFFNHGILQKNPRGGATFDLQLFLLKFYPSIISNLALVIVLAFFGVAELYLLWLFSYFSIYMVFSRIRNLAEHACVPDLLSSDPLEHTRTTLASWWERLSFAPNRVNYHLEHHLMPSVPNYRLVEFHKALKERGLLDNADIESGYISLTKRLVTQPI